MISLSLSLSPIPSMGKKTPDACRLLPPFPRSPQRQSASPVVGLYDSPAPLSKNEAPRNSACLSSPLLPGTLGLQRFFQLLPLLLLILEEAFFLLSWHSSIYSVHHSQPTMPAIDAEYRIVNKIYLVLSFIKVKNLIEEADNNPYIIYRPTPPPE